MGTNILGVNAFHGDSSAALLSDGQLVSAIEEERYNRMKHWAGLPALSASGCLSMAGIDRIHHVAVSRDPRANMHYKFLRVAVRPLGWRKAAGRAVNSVRLIGVKDNLIGAGVPGLADAKLHFVEHHRAHLASAFFASPFEEAAVISVDGFGEFSSVMWAVGRGNRMDVRGSVRFPHSLGL